MCRGRPPRSRYAATLRLSKMPKPSKASPISDRAGGSGVVVVVVVTGIKKTWEAPAVVGTSNSEELKAPKIAALWFPAWVTQ